MIKVIEGGTIAAAATAVIVDKHATPNSQRQFTIDRTFLFAIIDEQSGAVLFLGRVLDPTAG